MVQVVSPPTESVVRPKKRSGTRWLFTRLAFQNLLRRPTRTLMLLTAVALGTSAVFASFILACGIMASMEQSFSRMGADLIVVPEQAMVNITSALLTVQPTEATLDWQFLAEIKQINGVAQVAAQTIYHVPVMAGMPEHQVNLIAFDPSHDFTVMPWLSERLPRPMQKGDLLAGCRRTESVGEEVQPCGIPATIYGKLGRSGVGPFDESFFASYDTVAMLTSKREGDRSANVQPGKISAVLVRLAIGATAEQVRFAIARMPGIKVVTGARVITSTRQTSNALLGGMLAFTALMLMGSLILMGLLFAAIISERRREIGLLRAIGSRRFDVVQMLVVEAVFTTGFGGVCGIIFGIALLLVFQRSLVYYLETMHIDFVWPTPMAIAIAAMVCALFAALVGLIGAILPAWRTSGEEPYTLIHGDYA